MHPDILVEKVVFTSCSAIFEHRLLSKTKLFSPLDNSRGPTERKPSNKHPHVGGGLKIALICWVRDFSWRGEGGIGFWTGTDAHPGNRKRPSNRNSMLFQAFRINLREKVPDVVDDYITLLFICQQPNVIREGLQRSKRDDKGANLGQ